MMCDRIMPRSGRHCNRIAEFKLLVEVTGEEIELCPDCAHLYEEGGAVTYTPRRPTHAPADPFG